MKRLLTASIAALIALSLCGVGVRTVSAKSPSSLTSIQTHIVQTALTYQGTPYMQPTEYNPANLPSTGFSDVGFVAYVYQQVGISLPSDRAAMTGQGAMLTRGKLRPGDLVFFQNTTWAGLSHVGIYLGHGTFIHAEWYGVGVHVSTFRNDEKDGNYWHEHFAYGVRAWKKVPTQVVTTTKP
jgi:cell wall-associated NlpC family hydrolase